MQNAEIILKQLCVMYFYIGLGYLLYRNKLISDEGSRGLANFLLYVIIPATIIQTFCSEVGKRGMGDLLLSGSMGLFALLLSMAIAYVLFRKIPLDRFGVSFSNVSFMGMPLVTAMFGAGAVFYLAATSALINIFQWYCGEAVWGKEKSGAGAKSLLKNPFLVSFAVGVLFFLLKIRLPDSVLSPLRTLQNMNAPIGMAVLGTYLAQARIGEMFSRKRLYLVAFARLLLVPAVTLMVLSLFPMIPLHIRLIFMIVACAPIGSNLAIYAQRYNEDYIYAVQIVCLSTVFSIVTMPLCIYVAELVWK